MIVNVCGLSASGLLIVSDRVNMSIFMQTQRKKIYPSGMFILMGKFTVFSRSISLCFLQTITLNI